jgi:hypothetical protein
VDNCVTHMQLMFQQKFTNLKSQDPNKKYQISNPKFQINANTKSQITRTK